MKTSLRAKSRHDHQIKFLISPVFSEFLSEIIDLACVVQIFMHRFFVRTFQQEGKSWGRFSIDSFDQPEQNTAHWSNHADLVVFGCKRLSFEHFLESQAVAFSCEFTVKCAGNEFFIWNLNWYCLMAKRFYELHCFFDCSLRSFCTFNKL